MELLRIIIDRPMGSARPAYPEHRYPVNYGYVPGISAPDGEEQDAYVLGVAQPLREFYGKRIAVIHRRDDVEEKWVVCPPEQTFTLGEIECAVAFQERYFDSIIELV